MTENALQNTAQQVVTPAVLDELRHVRAISHAFRVIAEALEARLMESLWKIRKEVPERPAFDRLIREHTDLQPERAWLMAQTWETARRNRPLRELTLDRPNEALAFVTQFVEAGLDDRLENLSDDDHEVAKLLALPRRKRNQAIRELIAQGKAAQPGRSQADQEHIRGLEAERDGALEDREKALAKLDQARRVTPHPGADIQASLEELRRLEEGIAALAEKLTAQLPAAGELARKQIATFTDLAIESLERISGAALRKGS